MAWLGGLAVAQAVGIFSKENAAVLPGIMLLCDLTCSGRATWRRRIPAYGAAALPIALFFYMRGAVQAHLVVEFTQNPLVSAGFWTARITAFKVIGVVRRQVSRPQKQSEGHVSAFQAGARSYFLKDVKGRELVEAIRAVHAGQRPLPKEVASCLAERIPCPELSPRELEILKLIANGESNKEIAVRLAIGEGTVRVHASNVFAKLGCSDRAQAVAVAFHRGIIAIE